MAVRIGGKWKVTGNRLRTDGSIEWRAGRRPTRREARQTAQQWRAEGFAGVQVTCVLGHE